MSGSSSVGVYFMTAQMALDDSPEGITQVEAYLQHPPRPIAS